MYGMTSTSPTTQQLESVVRLYPYKERYCFECSMLHLESFPTCVHTCGSIMCLPGVVQRFACSNYLRIWNARLYNPSLAQVTLLTTEYIESIIIYNAQYVSKFLNMGLY